MLQYPDFASAQDLAGTNDPMVLTEVSGSFAYMHPLLLHAARGSELACCFACKRTLEEILTHLSS